MGQLGQDALQKIDVIDQETTRVAAVVTTCIADIAAGMSASQAQSVVDRLTTVATNLVAIAHDPNNPVPNPTPEQPV